MLLRRFTPLPRVILNKKEKNEGFLRRYSSLKFRFVKIWHFRKEMYHAIYGLPEARTNQSDDRKYYVM